MKEAFFPLHKQNIARAWQQKMLFLQALGHKETFKYHMTVI